MKFKDLFIKTKNSKTNQISLHLKKKKLKKLGMTPEELWELNLPKPRVRFYKK